MTDDIKKLIEDLTRTANEIEWELPIHIGALMDRAATTLAAIAKERDRYKKALHEVVEEMNENYDGGNSYSIGLGAIGPEAK